MICSTSLLWDFKRKWNQLIFSKFSRISLYLLFLFLVFWVAFEGSVKEVLKSLGCLFYRNCLEYEVLIKCGFSWDLLRLFGLILMLKSCLRCLSEVVLYFTVNFDLELKLIWKQGLYQESFKSNLETKVVYFQLKLKIQLKPLLRLYCFSLYPNFSKRNFLIFLI